MREQAKLKVTQLLGSGVVTSAVIKVIDDLSDSFEEELQAKNEKIECLQESKEALRSLVFRLKKDVELKAEEIKALKGIIQTFKAEVEELRDTVIRCLGL